MEPIRFIVLFSVVVFSAYCVHEAKKDVTLTRASQSKQQRLSSDIRPEDSVFMKQAIALSFLAQEQDHGDPFGSVVVRDGKVIGEGMNRTRVLHDPSAHAEMEAIRDACRKLSTTSLKGSLIYTSAQPCPMCLSLIYLSGIEKVYYGIPGDEIASMSPEFSVAFIYDAIAKPPMERPIPEVQLLSGNTSQVVDRYKKTNHDSGFP